MNEIAIFGGTKFLGSDISNQFLADGFILFLNREMMTLEHIEDEQNGHGFNSLNN